MSNVEYARICCDIPKNIKISLKVKAAELEKKENAIVTEALKQYLGVAC